MVTNLETIEINGLLAELAYFPRSQAPAWECI